MNKSAAVIEHYRTAKNAQDLICMANQDATMAVCMFDATVDEAYGFIETAIAVAKEKGWEISEGEG